MKEQTVKMVTLKYHVSYSLDLDTWLWKGFHCLRTGAAHKNTKRLVSPSDLVALAMRFYRKIHCLTSEFHVKFHLKNRYRTHRLAIRAISVFRVKFNVEFNRQAVNFSIVLYALMSYVISIRCLVRYKVIITDSVRITSYTLRFGGIILISFCRFEVLGLSSSYLNLKAWVSVRNLKVVSANRKIVIRLSINASNETKPRQKLNYFASSQLIVFGLTARSSRSLKRRFPSFASQILSCAQYHAYFGL